MLIVRRTLIPSCGLPHRLIKAGGLRPPFVPYLAGGRRLKAFHAPRGEALDRHPPVRATAARLPAISYRRPPVSGQTIKLNLQRPHFQPRSRLGAVNSGFDGLAGLIRWRAALSDQTWAGAGGAARRVDIPTSARERSRQTRRIIISGRMGRRWTKGGRFCRGQQVIPVALVALVSTGWAGSRKDHSQPTTVAVSAKPALRLAF